MGRIALDRQQLQRRMREYARRFDVLDRTEISGCLEGGVKPPRFAEVAAPLPEVWRFPEMFAEVK